jgi:cell wall assembly regulator SMI1
MSIADAIIFFESLHHPNPAATQMTLDTAARTFGVEWPMDFKEFYLAHDGGTCHGDEVPVEIRQLARFAWISDAVLGYYDENAPRWVAICDVPDGDFVALEPLPDGTSRFRDVGHETLLDGEEYSGIIALSFEELIWKILSCQGHYELLT